MGNGWQALTLGLLAQIALVASPRISHADPASTDAANIAAQTDHKQILAEQWRDIPRLTAQPIAAVIQFARVNDLIQVIMPAFEGRALSGRIKFTDLSDEANIGNHITEQHTSFFNFDYYSFSDPRVVVRHLQVLSSPSSLQIAGDVETLDDIQTVTLMQTTQDSGISIAVRIQQISAANATPLVHAELSGSSVSQLMREHPVEMARYVRPMFRLVRADSAVMGLDDKVAWQVMGDTYVPDASIIQRVKLLLSALNADEFQSRADADRELRNLGGPAAMYLMSVDRQALTPEQQARVDSLVSAYRVLSDTDVKWLRQDKNFLLDCLDSEEAALRIEALRRLESVIGRPISFDLNQPAPRRRIVIEQLRQQWMAAAVQPTSRPTGQPTEN